MCYDPGDHLKKCRSPDLEKCRKSASESAGPKRGAEESAEKSAPGSVSSTTFTERWNPEHIFRHLPQHPVLGRHFPKHFLGTFPGQGFGTFLDGRQDRNSCGSVRGSDFAFACSREQNQHIKNTHIKNRRGPFLQDFSASIKILEP